METSLIEVLMTLAKPGDQIEITTLRGSFPGTLKSFAGGGVLLETQEGQFYAHPEQIKEFLVRKSQDEGRPEATPVSVMIPPPESTTLVEATRSETAAPISVVESEPLSRFIFDRFLSEPKIPLPPLVFHIDHVDHNDQQEIVRWKNILEYAVRVRELQRVVTILPEMVRWSDRAHDGACYLLVGLVAHRIDDLRIARDRFLKALSLGSHDAAIALAHLAAAEQKWTEASGYLVCGLSRRPDPAPDHGNALLALGCCLDRAGRPEISGLASLYIRPLEYSTADRETRDLLLGLALLKNFPSAAKLACEGNIAEASRIAIGSKVFSPPPSIGSERAIYRTNGSSVTVNEAKEMAPATELFGRISAIYPEKGYGFITSSDMTVFFFHFNDVDDHDLETTLQSNVSGQRVSFKTFHKRPPNTNYDAALLVRQLDSSPETDSPVIRPASIPLPKTDKTYAAAKTAEHMQDFASAEDLYMKVISAGGRYANSAIKDLAQLLSRLNRDKEALRLLDANLGKFSEQRPVLYQKAHILVKDKRYREAGSIFETLEQGASAPERLSVARQRAYCTLLAGRTQDALGILKELAKSYPQDPVTQQMISWIDDIHRSADAYVDGPRGLAEVSSGLSRFAQRLIDSCDFTGVDERSKARGFFTRVDFKEVEASFERARGRRPSHKAKLLISLASMAQRSPETAGGRSPRFLLGRALAFSAEAATYENADPDTIRFYLAEALSLMRGSDFDLRYSLIYLVATHFSVSPQPGEISPRTDFRSTVRRLSVESGWSRFLADLPYYYLQSEAAAEILIAEVSQIDPSAGLQPSNIKLFKTQCSQERERLRHERIALVSRTKCSYTGAPDFQVTASTLHELRDQTRFELDRRRLGSLAHIANDAANYWLESDYIEKEAKLARLLRGLESFEIDVQSSPTSLSADWLGELAEQLRIVLAASFSQYKETTQPHLALTNVLSGDYYLPESDGTILLRLELASAAGGAPIEGIDVLVLEEDGLNLVQSGQSPALLRAGERREILLQVAPSNDQLRDQVFTVSGYVRYRTRSGELRQSEIYRLPVRTGDPASFSPVPNPYQNYAGGRSVDDPEMFKGRERLLERISEVLTSGPVGQCFVLYGQKRSGKTSVLNQLRRRLVNPCFPIEILIGGLDTANGQTNFFQKCVSNLRRQAEMELGLHVDELTWPSPEELRESPVASFGRVVYWLLERLTGIGWNQPRLVLLVDEFTYLYEYIREGIIAPTFMRNWKALLQEAFFSAVVVGQDSMPRFKQEFANEFGSTFDERLNYLAPEEAKALAEEPILLKGGSRYRGRALVRLQDLTAGSPFYTHIFCDRLVRHLNLRRAPFITEADIEEVAEGLVSGQRPLEIERFDPLITAAGESVAEAPRSTYLDVLTAIAASRGGARFDELPQIENLSSILKDLIEREAVMIDAGQRYSIRVGIFAQWLRVNRVRGREL